MEGKYYFFPNLKKINIDWKHVLCKFVFNDKSLLLYNDTRRFGTMHLLPKNNYLKVSPLNKLGFEPWEKECTINYLMTKLKRRKIAIKSFLLNQSIISGLGNIYANEVLFLAQINPLKPACQISLEKAKKILYFANKVMKDAIAMGGSTISSYTSSLQVDGKFQTQLKVHTRRGEQCFNCQQIIKKIKINGRGTYYCPKCQNEK